VFSPLEEDHPLVQKLDRADEVSTRARSLMDQHGLQDWTFEISKDKRTLGWCIYDTKTICFSEEYLHIGDAEITDTILHEIAHALVDPKNGHNHIWRAKCREIGARPERLAPPHAQAETRPHYVIKCSKCGKELARRYRIKNAIWRATSKCCGAKLQVFKIVRRASA